MATFVSLGEEYVVSALGFLLAWANAPFAVAAGVAAVFALLQVTGVLGLIAGGGDGDAEHEVDHDVDADHDADGDHEQDHDHDHDGDRSWAAVALAPLGFGKIPFSIIWQTFALLFAAVGFGLNFRFMNAGGPPLHSLFWTLPLAFLGGYLGVAVVARVLGPVLSSTDQEATSRAQLIGQTGVVISTKVDAEFGEVRIRDKTGHDLRVVCKLAAGAKSVPRETESVLVVDYDEAKGILYVEPFEDGLSPKGALGPGQASGLEAAGARRLGAAPRGDVAGVENAETAAEPPEATRERLGG